MLLFWLPLTNLTKGILSLQGAEFSSYRNSFIIVWSLVILDVLVKLCTSQYFIHFV